MGTALGLLSFVAPGIVGICLGYVLPRTDLPKLVWPAVVLGVAVWIVGGWFGQGSDSDLGTWNRVFVSALIIIFLVMVFAGGARLGQLLRQRQARGSANVERL
jgi:hypothetical protein